MKVCSPDKPQGSLYSLSLASIWQRNQPLWDRASRERSVTRDARMKVDELQSECVRLEERRIVAVTDPNGISPVLRIDQTLRTTLLLLLFALCPSRLIGCSRELHCSQSGRAVVVDREEAGAHANRGRSEDDGVGARPSWFQRAAAELRECKVFGHLRAYQ
jgi:hypothetical protein